MADREGRWLGGDARYGRLFTVDDVCAVVFAVLVHHGIEPTLAKVDTEGAMRMMDEAPEGDPVRPTFPADEPLFLLRGQDRAGIGGISGYYVTAKAVGASQDHGLAVVDAARRFAEFAQAHPDRVKVPD